MPTTSRYESCRVHMLKVSEYPTWRVKMTMFLEVIDPEYLNKIYDGPHKPTQLAIAFGGTPDKVILKEKKDCTYEDQATMMKDAKVRNLLHSSLDNVISNRVIGCNCIRYM